MLESKAKWELKHEANKEELEALSCDDIINRLLSDRGVRNEKEKAQFLEPKLAHLASPAYLTDIDKLKERVEQAIDDGEKIMVYGDYDADGVTATTIMYKALTRLGANCDYYIPNRFDEGYGLNEKAIERFALDDVALIITVDNGIADVKEVALANDLGIDVIITDHHEVQETLPDAYAIIHPHLSDTYPYKHLAGVGVAFQVARYLLGEMPDEWLELAAIGIISDLVPLTGENRIFVAHGLKRLNQTNNIGLKKLIEIADVKRPLDERDIGFILGPRLNAAGRLEDAALAVELLLTEDETEAIMLAEKIDALNKERQEMVEATVNEAERLLDEDASFIILASPNWHEGVLGIAASRLVNAYHRPVMLLTENEKTGEWKGSARSIPGFNLFENCMEVKDLFTSFGGHSQAAGMSLSKENLEALKQFLNKRVEEKYHHLLGKPVLKVDHPISLKHMTTEFVHRLASFKPFGVGNEQPLVLLEATPQQIRRIGADGQHLKLQFYQHGEMVEAIGFDFGKFAPFISQGAAVSVVGELQLNEWNGNVTVQLNVKDLAVAEWQLFDYRGKRHLSNVLPYIQHYKHNVIVSNSLEDVKEIASLENVEVMTYDDDEHFFNKTEVLYIYDLPPDLERLETILACTKPESVHVNFQATEDAFLEPVPSREKFKKVYAYLAQYDTITFNRHLPHMMKLTKLTKEEVSFILRVFYELEFISVKHDVITLNRHAEKRDLAMSKTYQKRLTQSEVERVLYYSTYDELKNWLKDRLSQSSKEEISHGL